MMRWTKWRIVMWNEASTMANQPRDEQKTCWIRTGSLCLSSPPAALIRSGRPSPNRDPQKKVLATCSNNCSSNVPKYRLMPALKKNIGKIHKRHENHLPPTKRMKTEGCCTIKREKCISNVSRKTVNFKLDFLNRYKNRREISGSQLCLSPPVPKIGNKGTRSFSI